MTYSHFRDTVLSMINGKIPEDDIVEMCNSYRNFGNNQEISEWIRWWLSGHKQAEHEYWVKHKYQS